MTDKVTEPKIFDLIIRTMGIVQKNGLENKKDVTMSIIQKAMSVESFERYEPFISMSIDMIKSVARNPTILKELKKLNCLSSCFNR
jgi:hypothetical protein